MKSFFSTFILFFVFQLKLVPGSLLEAVIADDRDKIEAALQSEVERQVMNTRGTGGQTALMFSVLGGKVNAVELLLKAGADVTIGENDGYTPMHGAGFQGRAEIAKLLIDHGISVHDVHTDGYTPFHRACWGSEKRHTDTVRVFLEAGVDPDLPGRDGRTCADMTRSKGTKKLLKIWKKDKNSAEL
jgi:ankyrin repeat protein